MERPSRMEKASTLSDLGLSKRSILLGCNVKKHHIVLALVFTCLLASNAFAAVKFKRFPHCSEGLVDCEDLRMPRQQFAHLALLPRW
jgi:hypothetical protein